MMAKAIDSLARRGPLYAYDVAAEHGTTPSAAARALNRCRAAGLVEYGERARFKLTDDGRVAAERARG
jgi:Mn-dependent DtxR family transcriptional regulator